MITDDQRDKEINDLINDEFLRSLAHHVNDDTPVIVLGLLGAAHTASDEHKPAIYQRIGELMYQHTLQVVAKYSTKAVDAEIDREGL